MTVKFEQMSAWKAAPPEDALFSGGARTATVAAAAYPGDHGMVSAQMAQEIERPINEKRFVLTPGQVELAKEHLGVSDAWIAAHVHIMETAPRFSTPDPLKAAAHKYVHQQELQRLKGGAK